MTAIDLSKHQALDTDPKSIQQINFTENLDRAGNKTMFSNTKEEKEANLDFSKGSLRVS